MAKKKSARRKSKPFRLYDMPFQTQRDFDRAVTQRAQGSYMPQLNQVRSDIKSEGRAHKGRLGDIGTFTSGWKSELDSAIAQANNALNSVIQSSGGSIQAPAPPQGADEIQRLGGTPNLTGPSVDLANTKRNNYLGGLAANILAGQQQFANSVPQTSNMFYTDRERRRHAGKLDQFRDQRQGILATVGTAKEKARGEIMDELRKGRAQQFQERVANKELGLKSRGLDIQEMLGMAGIGVQNRQLDLERKKFDWSKYMDTERIRLDQQQLDQQAESLLGEDGDADRQANAEAFARGAEAINQFLAPGDNDPKISKVVRDPETGKRTRKMVLDERGYRKRRKPGHLYAILTRRLGLPPNMALRLMMSVKIPGYSRYIQTKKQGGIPPLLPIPKDAPKG